MPNLAYPRSSIQAPPAQPMSTTNNPLNHPRNAAAPEVAAPATTILSNGAIVGISIGGAALLFVAVGFVFIQLARWQDRRRGRAATACPITAVPFDVTEEEDERQHHHHPRRLRKKSFVSERHVWLGGSEDGARSKRISLPVLPPVASRLGSFSIGEDFGGDAGNSGSSEGMTMTMMGEGGSGGGGGTTMRKTRSPEKQLGYGLYEKRRKTSWIDEDAIHGPRVSPRKEKSSAGRRRISSSWMFPGRGLGRSLSRRLSSRHGNRRGMTELDGSPTLPCTEALQQQQQQKQQQLAHHHGYATLHFPSPLPVRSRTGGAAGQQQRIQDEDEEDEIELPPRPAHYSAVASSPGNIPYARVGVPSSPAAQSPQRRHQRHQRTATTVIAQDAAQQLAGSARVPPLPPVPHHQRPRRVTQSATDSELSQILRMTAERLEDGHRSSRRQTLANPGPLRLRPGMGAGGGDAEGKAVPMAMDSRTTSPAKSQRSAPAAIAYSELEGCSPRVDVASPQPPTSRRHTRQVSQFSVVSEPDSLVVSRRRSQQQQPEPTPTALSSPSRLPRGRASPGGGLAQQLSSPYGNMNSNSNSNGSNNRSPTRPYSVASSESSALSTLYSEEERNYHHQSPPASELRGDDGFGIGAGGSPVMDMEKRAMMQALSACDILKRNGDDGDNEDMARSPKFPFEDGESPRPLRVKKGTLGEIRVPQKLARAQTATRQERCGDEEGAGSATGLGIGFANAAGRDVPRTRLSFTIHSLDEDPFTVSKTAVATPPAPPPRLSRLFSPLPTELPSDSLASADQALDKTSNTNPVIQVTNYNDSPTPSPKQKRVVPPPITLRAMTSSPTLGGTERRPSGSTSDGGCSSVYEDLARSENGSGTASGGASVNVSTATLVTVPTREALPTKTTATIDSTADGDRSNEVERAASRYAYRSEYPKATDSNGTNRGGATTTPTDEPLRSFSSSRRGSDNNNDDDDDDVESTYSQDETQQQEEDSVPPLLTPKTKKTAMRLAIAVAELRRQNSQISCVSNATATTTTSDMESPTLPELRGGGLSPGKGSGGGTNYLSLGSPEKYNKKDAAGAALGGSPIRRGGMGTTKRSRRGTVEMRRGDEKMAREAHGRMREVLGGDGSRKGGKGGNLGCSRKDENEQEEEEERYGRYLVTHATRLVREEEAANVRTTMESLGLYDDKGFLRSSPQKGDGLLSPLSG